MKGSTQKPSRPRGRPPTDEKICKQVVKRFTSTKSAVPLKHLAEEFNLSTTTVRQILKKAGIHVSGGSKPTSVHSDTGRIGTRKYVSLSDVAVEAGVSLSTASRALKGSPVVAESTRKQVAETARKLGYQLHPHVSTTMAAVRAGQIRKVGEVLAYLYLGIDGKSGFQVDVATPFGPVRKFKAAQDAAFRKGYTLEPFDFVLDNKKAKRLENVLYSRGIRGLVLDIPTFYLDELDFDLSRFHVVTFREQWRSKIHLCGHNEFLNMMLAFTHLWQLGYRRIGYIGNDSLSTLTNFRTDAGFLQCQHHLVPLKLRIPILYSDTLSQHLMKFLTSEGMTSGYEEVVNRVEETAWLMEQQWGELKQKMDQGADPLSSCFDALIQKWTQQFQPEAVICHHQDGIHWMNNCGLTVPDQIGVVHLNINEDVADWSGIKKAEREIAVTAVDVLVRQIQINDPPTPNYPIFQLSTGKWIDGKTTRHINAPLTPYTEAAKYWIDKMQIRRKESSE